MKHFRWFAFLAFISAAVQTVCAFVHPGCLSTQADLERMRSKVASGEQPWKSSWDILLANTAGFLDDVPEAQPILYAGGGYSENYIRLARDCAKAYQCALRYQISGQTAYGSKAVEILNAWASTMTGWAGDTNVSLRAGLYGYQLACAAELMRDYPGWDSADFAAFQQWMLTVFYTKNAYFLTEHHGTCSSHYWANWDLANLASVLAIGVLCDRQDLFNEGLQYFYNGVGNGSIRNAVSFVHPDGLGQWQESGRDQGHTTLGAALMGTICEIAWNQGIDLYGYDGNRFLAGCEYIAKYNLGNEVPFVTYMTCEYPSWPAHTVVSSSARGNLRPGWEMIFQHYVNRKGLSAPYCRQMADLIGPEGGGFNYGTTSGGFDQLGFTTLTHTREPISAGAAPSALRATVQGRQIILSWCGSAYAQSYSVQRSPVSGGPYTTIAATKLTYYIDAGLTPGTVYYYVVCAHTPEGQTENSEQVSAQADQQLFGTIIGTEGSYKNAGAAKDTVFDGSLKNFFDAPTGSAWAGLDLGEGVRARITQVKYCPRPGFAGRMVGGRFQGSNTADFSSGVVDLFTIPAAPAEGVLTSQPISNPNPFRFVRYLSPSNGYGNAAEIQFFGEVSGLNAPPAPTGLRAVSVRSSQIVLEWEASSGAAAYCLKRAEQSGGPYTILACGPLTAFADMHFQNGRLYFYTVSAINPAGESVSEEVSVFTPAGTVPRIPVGAEAGAEETGNWAAYSFDGDASTRWCSDNIPEHAWIRYDLGAVYPISQIQILFYKQSTRTYPIQIRVDEESVFSGTTARGSGYWETMFVPVSGRYVTVSLTAANSDGNYWFSLYEIRIGSPAGFIANSFANADALELKPYLGLPLSDFLWSTASEPLTFVKDFGPQWLTVSPEGGLSGIPGDSDVGGNEFVIHVEGGQDFYDTARMAIRVAGLYSGVRGLVDISGLAARWLDSDCADFPPCGGADLDGDAQVGLSDFSILAYRWLSEGVF